MTLEVYEWISNFIPHYAGHVTIYPCRDPSWCMLVKAADGPIALGVLLNRFSFCYSSAKLCVVVVYSYLPEINIVVKSRIKHGSYNQIHGFLCIRNLELNIFN